MNPTVLIGLGKNLSSGIKSLVTGIYNLTATVANMTIKIVNFGLQALFEFNDAAIQSARNIGMPFQQSVAYTKVLITDTEKLALAYGVTVKQIAALQDSYVDATGKAILLNTVQKEHLLQAEKLIGAQTNNNITKGLAAIGNYTPGNEVALQMIAKMSKSGLNLKTSSAEFAKNLELANKYSFANGVEGIARMTALSQKLNFNLSSISSVADKFTNFSDAIEASAKLQNLGGMGAAYGANPLTLMYEAMEDPESLIERTVNMFKSMATFDKKTGTGKISGLNLQILKTQAEALGLDPTEVTKMTKNSVRADAIQGQMGGVYDQLNASQQDFITNKATWDDKNQEFIISVLDEKTSQIENIPVAKLTPTMVRNFQKQAALTTTDAVKLATRKLVSTAERQEAFFELVKALLAEALFPALEDFFNIQVKTFHFLGTLASFAVKTIFTDGWWKMVLIDAGSVLVKALIAFLAIENPIIGLLAGFFELGAQIASFLFPSKNVKPILGSYTLLAVNNFVDNIAQKARNEFVDAKTQAEYTKSRNGLIQEGVDLIKYVGGTFGKVVENIHDKLSHAVDKYNRSVVPINAKGDVSQDNKRGGGNSSHSSSATYNNNYDSDSNDSQAYTSYTVHGANNQYGGDYNDNSVYTTYTTQYGGMAQYGGGSTNQTYATYTVNGGNGAQYNGGSTNQAYATYTVNGGNDTQHNGGSTNQTYTTNGGNVHKSHSEIWEKYFSPEAERSGKVQYLTLEETPVQQSVTHQEFGDTTIASENDQTNIGQKIVDAIDHQTAVMLTAKQTKEDIYNTTITNPSQASLQTQFEQVSNSQTSDVMFGNTIVYGQEPVGSIVKGGEVTNGVTPITPSSPNSTSQNLAMSFEPLNLNISGTLTLVGSNGGSNSIDARELLDDPVILSWLSREIQQNLNNITANSYISPFGSSYAKNIISATYFSGGLG